MTVEEANISLEYRHSETTSNNCFPPIFRIYWEEKLTLFVKLILNAAEVYTSL